MTDIAALHQQASQLYHAGQPGPAAQLYRQMIARAPQTPAIYLEFSNLLMQQGNNQEALQTLETTFEQFPTDDGVLSALGTLLSNQGNSEKGLELIESAIRLHPESIVAYGSLAYIQHQNGHIELAITSARKAAQLGPENPESHFLLGGLLNANKQSEEAIEAFEATLRIAPQWLAAYLQLGTLLEEATRYTDALNCYKKAQAIAPANSELDKKIGLLLHATSRADEAEQYFRLALSKNNADADTHVMLANVLRDQERIEEAADSYRAALKYAPDHQIASKNLQRLNQSKILQWHFDMLADTARNEAYDQALRKVAAHQTQVLDIGTGSGLLAMMAARAGARQVTGCEMVQSLAEVSRQVIQDNQLSDRITVVHKKSTAMTVGEDIPEKASLLVSEILDAGLLGESVLPTLRHAWANLLQHDAGIIPKAADIYGVIIESHVLKQVNPINKISGFDLSAFNHFRTSGKLQSRSLSNTEHSSLSNTFPVQSFDFRDLPPITTDSQPNTRILEIPATQSGSIHGVAFWFSLHLDDEITVSTAPDGEMKHWKQAIYLFDDSQDVEEGESIKIQVRQFETRIDFNLMPREI